MQINMNNIFKTKANKNVKKSVSLVTAIISLLTLSACMSTSPTMGSSNGNTITGGAAGSSASNKNSGLASCDEPLGTLSVFEDTSLTWWHDYRARYPKLGSTTPVIRLMIQQSNCFVIVERGQTMAAMNRERQLMQSGQLRGGSNLGGGQMVAADYTISPEIQFSEQGTEGVKAIGGAMLGSIGSLLGGGVSKSEAATTLLLIDNRSGVQVSAAVGNAEDWDYDIFSGLFASGAIGGAGAYSKTPEGKVITAAFADSYNQMVKALRSYKAQEVKGGLGKGGLLTVGGADDVTPTATKHASIVSAPTPTKVVHEVNVNTHTTVNRQKNYDFDIEEYDEDALEDYYNALKQSAEMTSGLTAISATSSNVEHKNMAMAAIGMFASRLASSKIELEHWPMDAKQEAWRVLGKRIEKHNSIFLKQRELALKNKSLDADFITAIQGIELITKESLFGS